MNEIRRAFYMLVAATVVLYLAMAALALFVFIAGQQTSAALCTLRGDLERRVEASRLFLAEHPNGIPGISVRTIRQGIDNQQRSIEALSDLNCS